MNRTRTEQITKSNEMIRKSLTENLTEAEDDTEMIALSFGAAKVGVLEDISLTLALIADCACNMINKGDVVE